MGELPPPREFQITAHEALRQGFAAGHRCQILVAPTGAGKTYCALRIVRETLAKGKRALFICDRTALINQTEARSNEYGLTDYGIIQAEHPKRDPSRPYQIASIQTIAARDYSHETDVTIIDECHTQYEAAIEHINRTRGAVIGLTATPCTKGLGNHYTHVVNAATMHELTQISILAVPRILTCVTPDMTGAATVGGEWTAKAASERELQIRGDVVEEWIKNAENRKTIAFGPDIAYCVALARSFNEAGIWAETYTSRTPDSERKQLLQEFEKPQSRIRVLISVEALAKGFDVPDIGCVIDARPLRKSLSTAIQMWGRGLRSAPGKTDCLFLDHSGNFRRFLDDFTDVYFNGFGSLDQSEKLDRTIRKDDEDWTPKGCPTCGYTPFSQRCMACGHEKEARSIQNTAAGVMQEVRIGKKVLAANKYDLWCQLCTYARAHSKPDKQAGRAWHLYRDILSENPAQDWRLHSTPDVLISMATRSRIQASNIRYRKAREKAVA